MKNAPTRAFVLAAGFGTRLLPLTRELPKPMLPIWGVPAIERTLRMLQSWGVRDVLINLHHLPEEIAQHVSHRRSDGLRVQFSFEPQILGTGGALPHARWWMDGQPFWMINADVVSDVNPAPLLAAFRPGKTMASVWLHPTRGPRTVIAKRGYVVEWRGRGGATFCGLQLLSPEILRYLPPSGEASIIAAYEKAMEDGWRIAASEVPGAYWADIGTPAQYLQTHRELRGGRTFVSIAASARVARGAKLRDVVILDGARIGARAEIENAVIGKCTIVQKKMTYLAMRAEKALDSAEAKAFARLGWPAAKTTAIPMGPRGSGRTFTRLVAGRKSAMLVHYNPERAENTLYAGHARFLKALGVPVPDIFVDFPREGVTIFEDLGDDSIQTLFPSLSPKKLIHLYRQVLDVMLVFHERGAASATKRRISLVPAFRWKLYHWEHDYFAEHFLKGRQRMAPEAISAIKSDLHRLAAQLTRCPRALVHRDLQSSNILLRHGKPALIDFQGMRFGPAVYDLASLLCDPYVQIPEEAQLELLEYYAAKSCAPAQTRKAFWPATVQRLGQALGAYARLGANPDTAAFEKFIPPALAMMRRALRHVTSGEALNRWAGRSDS